MPEKNREILLASRPVGWPDESNFELAQSEMPQPEEGEVLVRNVYMSVDPYMRGRMMDVKSYVPPFEIGEPLQGGAIGVVVGSRAPEFQEGDCVSHVFGWREYVTTKPRALTKVTPAFKPVSAYLGVLGMPGYTAYWGLLEIGQPKAGETVFVSGAAGAVGMVAGQIAKIKGCRVVGSAGSAEKVAFLKGELGFDEAFNYKDVDLEKVLSGVCPNGVDIYFDNVGGDQLQAALNHLNPFGRIAACGMISQYNNEKPAPGPNNLTNIVRNRLTMKGFIISDHFQGLGEYQQQAQAWLTEGRLKNQETVVEGIENAPRAFLDMLRGGNLGKMVVKLGPDPFAA